MQQQQDPIINSSLIVCRNNNQAVQLCSNQKCRQNAFVCQDQKCLCHSHTTCIMTSCQELINTIEKQKQLIPQANKDSIEAILKIYDITIEYLSTKRLEFEESIGLLGFSDMSKTLIKSINEAELSSIDGSFISQLFQQCRNQFSSKTLKSKSYFQQMSQSILKQVKKVFNKLEQDCKLWELNLNSSIANKEDQQFISEQFDKGSIKFKKLFQASLYQFSANAFRKRCLNIGSTLTLIQTSQGQKFAAFFKKGWKQPQFKCYDCPTDCQLCRNIQSNREASLGDSSIYNLTHKKFMCCDYFCHSTLGKIQNVIQEMTGPLIGYDEDSRILQICEQQLQLFLCKNNCFLLNMQLEQIMQHNF